ncbi:hypothetical protein DL93DRAFT_2082681, partial [Clavulina sp. PMI_390]
VKKTSAPAGKPSSSASLASEDPQVPWYEAPVGVGHPAWHVEYITRTTDMNPFLDSTVSDTLFEVCYALHSCGQPHHHPGSGSFSTDRAKAGRSMLRDRLDAIVSHELQVLHDFARSSPRSTSYRRFLSLS